MPSDDNDDDDNLYDGIICMPLGEELANEIILAEPDGHSLWPLSGGLDGARKVCSTSWHGKGFPDGDTWQTCSATDFSGCDDAFTAFEVP